ncbi:MAG: NACHT domain-containing protein [Coleofasciculaceae cyanobacterium]
MTLNTYGPVVKARVKRLLEALLSFVNYEFEESDLDIEFKWEAEDTSKPKLIIRTTLANLHWLTKKDKHSGELTKAQIRQALKLLDKKTEKNLVKILEDNRTQTQGVETWHFTLTLWSKDKEKNLQKFERVWEDNRSDKSKDLEATFKKSEVSAEALQDEIDWQECCRKMLPTDLSINPLLHGDDVILTIEDIVPLELVERKQRPQQKDDFSPEHFQLPAPTEYELPVEHNKFLAHVLETENSIKNRDRKIAIIGEPGAGKTTILQEIAKEVEGVGGLPIFVKLADLEEKALEKYLLEDWLKYATGKRSVSEDIQDDFVEQFNASRVWLLLDGVDEIAATGNLLSSLEKQLKGWIADARIVLTCRLNVWDVGKNDLYTFEKYRIQQLSYPDLVGSFIHNFFSKAGEPTKGEKLIEKLERSQPRIKDLVKNPLRLTLLCRIWKRRQEELPKTKAELYEWFVETFYEWKDKPEIDLDKRRLLEHALGELAKKAIDKETTKFRLRESFVRQELDKFDKSLFDLACRVGWIINVGVAAENSKETVYAFYHPTFQEYFGALAVEDWRYFLNHVPDNPTQGIYRIFEAQWKEVFLLWLGREDVAKEGKEKFIKMLVEFEDGCQHLYWYQAYFLAVVGIAEFRDCTQGDEIVAQVVQWAFGYFDDIAQAWQSFYPLDKKATTVLRETLPDKAILALTKLLHVCQDQQIRRKVAEKNGKMFDERLLGEVALTLLELSPANLEATKAISELINNSHDDFIPPFLLNNLELNAQVEVLRRCVFLNSQSNQRPADNLKEDKIGSPNEIIDLIDFINTTDVNPLQLDAMSRLEKIVTGNPEAISPVIAVIKRSLRSNQETDRYPLFKALECMQRIGIGSLEAINVLIEVVSNDSDYGNYDPGITFHAIAALAAIGTGNPDVFHFLMNLVHTEKINLVHKEFHWAMRLNALGGLGAILSGDLFGLAVTNLRGYLQDSVCKNNRALYINCYWTLWHCAQTMPYPDFHKAWHSSNSPLP